jgi:BirA family biotin operon repressor/biotin-[acetyl-CoA-carboxylase] ligase
MNTREKLLSELRANAGSFVSGPALTDKLRVSRAAVSKHVATLKQSGYRIDSTPGKGYMFMDTPDLLLPGEIRHGLDTTVFGRKTIDYHAQISSTSDRAKELAAEGAEEGTLVVSENQSCGRGRKGRTWFAADGCGINLSMILRPAMNPAEASRITLMTAVALAETLLHVTGLPVTIKWPNDILVRGKKLSGILTEMSMEMDRVDHVVVGVGVNVNTRPDQFPPEVRDNASSLFIEKGETVSRPLLVREFLRRFEECYALVTGSGFKTIMKRWKSLSDIIGRTVTVDIIGTRINGRVTDVDEDGILILQGKDGNIHRVISGDVLLQDL